MKKLLVRVGSAKAICFTSFFLGAGDNSLEATDGEKSYFPSSNWMLMTF